MTRKFRSAVALAEEIRKGTVTVREAVEEVYAAIQDREAECHCYVSLREKEEVLQEADRLQEKINAGVFGASPVAGVPMAVKDNICVQGVPATCSSRMLEQFVPTYTATAVERLKEAGALIIGKTNMDEFGMGSTTESSWFGPTKNPWNTGRVPGGSSGGSAAAVAAGECIFALGSDTGGSIRQPGSYCGIVGLKPTYGTVSRSGLIAYTSSLEQIGPMTNTVEDCAAVLEVIAGKDEKDSTTIERDDLQFVPECSKGVAGMRIGLPKEFLVEGVQEEVKQTVLLAADYLQKQGAVIEEFSLGMMEYVVPVYCVITSAEASSNLARFDGVHFGYCAKEGKSLREVAEKSRMEGFGREVRKRIMLGTHVVSEEQQERYYQKALRARELICRAYKDAFRAFDCILGPVAPRTAPVLNEKNKSTLTSRLEDIYTVPANLAGVPAISVPFGRDANGMPIGVQLTADYFQEKKLLRAAAVLEQGQKNEEET